MLLYVSNNIFLSYYLFIINILQYGLTSLHYSSANGHKDISDLLISKGANINDKNNVSLYIINTDENLYMIIISIKYYI